jgi:hypothetical protein
VVSEGEQVAHAVGQDAVVERVDVVGVTVKKEENMTCIYFPIRLAYREKRGEMKKIYIFPDKIGLQREEGGNEKVPPKSNRINAGY